MKCPNCGSPVSADARFCGECGQALMQLGKSLVESAPAPASPTPDLSGLHTIDGMETKAPKKDPQRVLSPGDVFADRYEVKQLIGEGGMGVVYRAGDRLTERDVALKLIRADRLAGKDAVSRLIREGVTSRDIRHPNVVAVYDVGQVNGQPYMSMEFLNGQSLRAWTRKRLGVGQECSMRTAANIVSQILEGLEAAHKAGVVHRDLKPENVMLAGEPSDQDANLKILDFGVARAAGAGDTGATSLGTRGYMAPEQITAPDAAQPSADLYSLSVMFYELLVGVVPQGHWQPPSAGRSDVPAAIDELIQRGLSNNPRQRPQSVAEYGQALASAMQPGSGKAPWLQKAQDAGLKPLLEQFTQSGTKQAGMPAAPVAGGRAGARMWQYMVSGFTKNWANGSGRASRMEYWSVFLATTILGVIGYMIDVESLASGVQNGSIMISNTFASDDQILAELVSSGQWYPVGIIIALLASVGPAFSVTSRRLHDLGVTGWAALVVILQPIGTLFSIGIGIPAGKPGDNQYGPDPLGATG